MEICLFSTDRKITVRRDWDKEKGRREHFETICVHLGPQRFAAAFSQDDPVHGEEEKAHERSRDGNAQTMFAAMRRNPIA